VGKIRTYPVVLLAALLTVSCGTLRESSRKASQESPVILPLTDSTEIAASRARAQQVLDSLERLDRTTAVPSDSLHSGEAPSAAAVEKTLHERVVDYAKTFLGVPYRLGASGPDRFDCSGYTSYVFREFGYNLPHYSVSQFRDYPRVESFADLQLGDLVFFGVRNSVRDIGHVGIVTEIDRERGFFWFIHASTSHGVEIQRSTHPYFMMRYMGAVRILPDVEE